MTDPTNSLAGTALPAQGLGAEFAGRAAARRTLWSDALARLRRNPGAVVGAVGLVVLVLIAIFAPALSSHDPLEMIPRERLQPPNPQHWLGTDIFGRDILTRLMYGARISLVVGVISVTISVLIGVSMGLTAGYYGGWIDTLTMRLIDVMLAFPGILLALAIVAIMGPGLLNVMIAVGVAAVPTYARVVRGAVLSTKQNAYVDAALVVGCGHFRVLAFHILPNVLAPIIVIATLRVGSAIITGAALSFLGLGAQPPTPEWGAMLTEGRNYLRAAWWITTFPGLAIMITVLSMNLVGDGLRDALDPRMRV
jgi:peptide/nickel transport system permease protein